MTDFNFKSQCVENNAYAIAIVGGGFAGMMAAAELVRRSSVPLQLHIYEPLRPLGLGAAYSTVDVCHLLNVPARHMGAWADDHGDFYRWLHAEEASWRNIDPLYRSLEVLETSFLPRALYAYYLQNLWQSSLLEAKSKGIAVYVHRAEVTDLHTTSTGVAVIDNVQNTVNNNDVDAVVLALGVSPSSLNAKISPAAVKSALYLADPWHDADCFSQLVDNLVTREESPVAILGSGLTTVDIAASLLAKGFKGQIAVLSRSGQLPQPHASYNTAVQLMLPRAEHLLTAHELLRQWRHMASGSADWRAAIDALRPQTTLLWRQLPLSEQRSILRHLGSLWNRHRHRAPSKTWQRLQEACVSGQLHLIAGSVDAIELRDDARLCVSYSTCAPAHAAHTLSAAVVINALGWESDAYRRDSPLLQHLLERGWVAQHQLRRGLQVAEGCRLAGDAPCPIYGVGALLAGEYFESTAVPEVRQQCAAIAQSLLKACSNHWEKNKC